jgi:Undecaprenyl-phosphate galactose phosphotransferase WbaP
MIKMNTVFELRNETARTGRSFLDSHARLWMSGCLLATDMLSLCASLLIAMQVRQLPQLAANINYVELLGLLGVILSVLFYRKGLYPAVGMHYVDELRHIISSTTLAYLILVAASFFSHTALVYSRLVLFVAGMLSLGLIPLDRYLIRRLLIHTGLWGEPTLIIGNLLKTRPIVEYFTLNLHLGIRPVAVSSNKPLEIEHGFFACPLQPTCAIKLYAEKLNLATALILLDDLEDAHALADRYRFVFRRVILIRNQENNFSLTSLETLDFLNVLGLQVRNDLLSSSSQITKRLLDILGSFLGLLLIAPLLALVALMIKLDSRGQILYRQPRVGKHGAVFHLLKFRTMHENADQIFTQALENDLKLQNEWTLYQKLRKDPRLTRVGALLRKFSIDELPQLWNVLAGQMSLVGPRPFMLAQRSMYGKYIKQYIRVLPGMTGLWQVSGRSETTFARRAALDREYIQRWSIWLDIYIIFKTVKIILFERSAY